MVALMRMIGAYGMRRRRNDGVCGRKSDGVYGYPLHCYYHGDDDDDDGGDALRMNDVLGLLLLCRDGEKKTKMK